MDLHYIQILILKELMFNPKSRFKDLNIANITSEHLSYHIKSLQKRGFIRKRNNHYALSAAGKEFANTFDSENFNIEKQPKTSVLIIAKKNKYLLIHTRTKQPYFGYRGFITGKVRFGETILEAAKRELLEETGLDAQFEHKYSIHDLVYTEKEGLVEDKFFHIVRAFRCSGSLKNSKEGKNNWILEKKFYNIKKKYYNEDQIYEWFKAPPDRLIEKRYIIQSF